MTNNSGENIVSAVFEWVFATVSKIFTLLVKETAIVVTSIVMGIITGTLVYMSLNEMTWLPPLVINVIPVGVALVLIVLGVNVLELMKHDTDQGWRFLIAYSSLVFVVDASHLTGILPLFMTVVAVVGAEFMSYAVMGATKRIEQERIEGDAINVERKRQAVITEKAKGQLERKQLVAAPQVATVASSVQTVTPTVVKNNTATVLPRGGKVQHLIDSIADNSLTTPLNNTQQQLATVIQQAIDSGYTTPAGVVRYTAGVYGRSEKSVRVSVGRLADKVGK